MASDFLEYRVFGTAGNISIPMELLNIMSFRRLRLMFAILQLLDCYHSVHTHCRLPFSHRLFSSLLLSRCYRYYFLSATLLLSSALFMPQK